MANNFVVYVCFSAGSRIFKKSLTPECVRVHVKRLKVMGAAHNTHAPCSDRLAVVKRNHLIFNLPTFSPV